MPISVINKAPATIILPCANIRPMWSLVRCTHGSLVMIARKSPAANDGAGHARSTGLTLCPMAEPHSPSTAASVVAAPGPFCWRRESMGGLIRCQTAYYRRGEPIRRTNPLITLKGVIIFPSQVSQYGVNRRLIRHFQNRAGLPNLIRRTHPSSYAKGLDSQKPVRLKDLVQG